MQQLPDLIKQNVEKLKQLKDNANLTEVFPGNAAGSPSADSVGKGSIPYQRLEEEDLTEEEMEEACGKHHAMEEGGGICELELEYNELEEEKPCGSCKQCMSEGLLTEAKYKGRKVTLNKPMRGDVKKFKVFVRDPKTGNVKKVNFGEDRKSTRLNSSHVSESRMPSSA